MQALFVHGMGRTRRSGWPVLQRLKRAGIATHSFGYRTSIHDFDTIAQQLAQAIARLAVHGEYIVIGHSLGGVLLRAAVAALAPELRRPQHAFLLGSPVQPARMAISFRNQLAYRLITRDCGRLLGSAPRMAALPAMQAPTTAVVGMRGVIVTRPWFGSEPNDGIVAASEVLADWQQEQLHIDVMHSYLPASRLVSDIILARLSPRADQGMPLSTNSANPGR